MTEFVFSMNYFFWLLAFKDISFSDELKQGLLGARLTDPALLPLLKAVSRCCGRAFGSHYHHSLQGLLFFLSKLHNGSLAIAGGIVERTLHLESKRPQLYLQLFHLLLM